jgi:hypothetical protein
MWTQTVCGESVERYATGPWGPLILYAVGTASKWGQSGSMTTSAEIKTETAVP